MEGTEVGWRAQRLGGLAQMMAMRTDGQAPAAAQFAHHHPAVPAMSFWPMASG